MTEEENGGAEAETTSCCIKQASLQQNWIDKKYVLSSNYLVCLNGLTELWDVLLVLREATT